MLEDTRPYASTLKPGFGNLLLWKVVYEYDGRFYVDAVRAGISVDICEGQSIEKLDIGRHFPWLDQASQQHRDIERFRWFSDGYLGWSHHDPLAIVDMRYSAMPNEIAPLWGIRLSPEAHGANHVTYFTDRAGRARQSTGYWDMLADGQC